LRAWKSFVEHYICLHFGRNEVFRCSPPPAFIRRTTSAQKINPIADVSPCEAILVCHNGTRDQRWVPSQRRNHPLVREDAWVLSLWLRKPATSPIQYILTKSTTKCCFCSVSCNVLSAHCRGTMESHGGGSREPCPICMNNKSYSTGNRGGLLQHMMRVHPTKILEFRRQPKDRVRTEKKGPPKSALHHPAARNLLMKGTNFLPLLGMTMEIPLGALWRPG
jgi:hypothetical protein